MTNSVKPRAHLHVVKEGEKPSDGIPLTDLDKSNIERLQALMSKGFPVPQVFDLKNTYIVALLEELLGEEGVKAARSAHAAAIAEQLDGVEATLDENIARATLLQGVPGVQV